MGGESPSRFNLNIRVVRYLLPRQVLFCVSGVSTLLLLKHVFPLKSVYYAKIQQKAISVAINAFRSCFTGVRRFFEEAKEEQSRYPTFHFNPLSLLCHAKIVSIFPANPVLPSLPRPKEKSFSLPNAHAQMFPPGQ